MRTILKLLPVLVLALSSCARRLPETCVRPQSQAPGARLVMPAPAPGCRDLANVHLAANVVAIFLGSGAGLATGLGQLGADSAARDGWRLAAGLSGALAGAAAAVDLFVLQEWSLHCASPPAQATELGQGPAGTRGTP